jgi:uncharacterized protein
VIRLYWLALLLFLSCCLPPAHAGLIEVPALKARVTDLTGTLEERQREQLEWQLAGLEQRKGAQLAVLLIPTCGEEGIERFAVRAFREWKLGRRGIDDGVLLLIAKDDHAVRIEVGYGLEGAISDVLASRIIGEQIVPRFRSGDFAGGVQAGVDSLVRLVEGEALPAPAPEAASGSTVSLLGTLLFFGQFFLVPGIVRRWFGNRAVLRWGLVIVLPPAYSALRGGNLGEGIFFGVVAFFICMGVHSVREFLTGGVSSDGSEPDRPGVRNRRDDRGGSSDDGGGFGGGGGTSGGGGATGRW